MAVVEPRCVAGRGVMVRRFERMIFDDQPALAVENIEIVAKHRLPPVRLEYGRDIRVAGKRQLGLGTLNLRNHNMSRIDESVALIGKVVTWLGRPAACRPPAARGSPASSLRLHSPGQASGCRLRTSWPRPGPFPN